MHSLDFINVVLARRRRKAICRHLRRVALKATISLMDSGFQCAGCGEWNPTSVDESAGRTQKYVEDCQVCCKPNLLHVTYDSEADAFFIDADLE
jgi:hypothetical protein